MGDIQDNPGWPKDFYPSPTQLAKMEAAYRESLVKRAEVAEGKLAAIRVGDENGWWDKFQRGK